MWAQKTGIYCFQHDPDKATERDRARSRGGRGKALLSQEVLIGEVVDRIEKADPGKKRTVADLRYKDHVDIQHSLENDELESKEKQKYGLPSHAESAISAKRKDQIIKCIDKRKELEVLELKDRVEELEDLARELNQKQLN